MRQADAKSQSAAMAKAKTALKAAVEKVLGQSRTSGHDQSRKFAHIQPPINHDLT